MAQALLNSLNNMQDNGIFSVGLTAQENADVSCFETVLNSQTEDLAENGELADAVTEAAETVVQTLSSIKENLLSEAETLGLVISEAIAENGAEKALAANLAQEAEELTNQTLNNDEIKTESVEEPSTAEKENPQNIQADNVIQDDITNEEPTMQKELTPLENSTAGIFLQSQTKTHSSILNEENETTSQNSNSEIKYVSTNANDKNLNLQSQTKSTFTYDEPIIKTEKAQNSKVDNVIDDKMVEKLNIESVESEAGNNNQGTSDLMQHQSAEEHGVKAVIQGEVKYEEVSSKTLQQAVQSQQKNLQGESASRIIDQISKQMNNLNANSKVNIVLNPESMGKVVLQLVNTKNGLTALFTVTNQDTKALLSNGLEGLKENLLSHGVSVDNISIKVSETEGEYKQDWTEQGDSKGGNKGQQNRRQKNDPKAFEQTMFEINNKEKDKE